MRPNYNFRNDTGKSVMIQSFGFKMLFILMLFGQQLTAQVSAYSVTQQTFTYQTLTSSTVAFAAGWDSSTAVNVPLPFTFYFNGVANTSVYLHTDGYVTFGASGGVYLKPISEAMIPGVTGVVSAFGMDLISVGTGAQPIVYGVEGTAPYRIFIIQWTNARRFSETAGHLAGDNLNFQIRLSETVNRAEVRYGSCTASSTSANTVQVGLRGSTNTDFNNRSSATSWTATTAGTTNNASVNTTNTIMPTSGLAFYYLPPACGIPYNLVGNGISTTTANLSWTAPTSAPAGGYQWEVRSSGFAGDGATGLAASGSTAAGIVTATANGLSAGTNYTLYVRANCNGSFSSWNAVSFSTQCTPTNPPYTQNFESAVGQSMPACTSSQNLGGSSDWMTMSLNGNGFTSKAIGCNNAGSPAKNNWFYTQGINLTAGTVYNVSYKYGNNSSTEKLKVTVGTQAIASAMTTVLANHTAITGGVAQTNVATFTPSTTGIYYFGFNAYSDAGQWYLYLDDISVAVPSAPACSATYSPVSGATNVSRTATLTWAAPIGVTSYNLYFGTSSNPPLVLSNTTVLSYTPPTTMAANTTYYWRVNPTNSVGTTTCAVNSFVTDNTNIYCIPTTTNGCGSGDHITNTTFSTINNNSLSCLTASYSNYKSGTAGNVAQLGTYPISVSIANGGPEYGGAWIDWNQNGTFETSEFITLTDATNSAPWIYTGTVTVPANAVLGTTVLRVRSSYNANITADSACATYSYGETEDYTVNVSPCVPVTWYADADNDGFGNPAVSISACTQPAGYVSNNTDCNPSAKTYADVDGDGFGSGAPTPCGVTNNTDCNATAITYADVDGDGYGSGAPTPCGVTNNTDCSPSNAAIYRMGTLYVDADGDGYTSGASAVMCYGATAPTGYILSNTTIDCNDAVAAIYRMGTLYVDADHDGYTSGATTVMCYGAAAPTGYIDYNTAIDCNDAAAAINPGQAELLGNGIDDNCNGHIDELTYCGALAYTGYPYIASITFNNINNNSPYGNGYDDYTSVSTPLMAGATYNWSAGLSGLLLSNGTDQEISAWIDYNQDGDFIDPGENILASPLVYDSFTSNVTIPITATLGATRMRVRVNNHFDFTNYTSCGDSFYGDVEDYTVVITPFTASLPVTGTLTVPCGISATVTDDGGGSGNYSNNANGTVVFQNSGNGVITLTCVHDIEPNADRLLIYTGTPGNLITQVGNFTGIGGGYSIVSPPGVSLTAIFTSNGFNPFYGGFVMNADFSGDCNGCLGLPNPGNTLSSAPMTCTGTTVNLSLQNTTPGNGVTYQWQQASSQNGIYTDILDATAAVYSPTVTAATWYRANVTCSGATTASNPVGITLKPDAQCYCTPFSVGCSYGIAVKQVTLNTLDHYSGADCGNNGYSDFTSNMALTTTLRRGMQYNMTILPGVYQAGIAAWIDFNDDGVLADPSERVVTSNVLITDTPGIYQLNIPCTATIGPHRLRIRTEYLTGGESIPPCGPAGYGFGEVEDYTITIQSNDPTITATAADTTICPNATTMLTANAMSGTVTWYTGSNGTGTNLGTGATLAAGPGTYYARLSDSCGQSAEASVTVNAKISVSITGVSAAQSSICENATTTLTANGIVGDDAIVNWYTGTSGTGTHLGTGATLNAGAGTYYAYVTGDCGTAQASIVVTALPNATYYADADADGFGNPAVFLSDCTPPSGYVLNNSDCDDNNANAHQTFAFYVDADADGYGTQNSVQVCAADAQTPPTGYSTNNTDCDDSNANAHQTFAFYVDADGDTFGAGNAVEVCAVDANTPPIGYSLSNTDCNDSVAAIHPNAIEIPFNGTDDDCDGIIDETGTVTTSLLTTSCGTTLTSIGSLIGITTLAGQPITGYRIKVTNGAEVQVIERSVPHFAMTQFASYAYATTYTVEIQLQRAGIWQASWGNPCLVSTPAILESGAAGSVNPSQCGITLSKINTLIATSSLAGVTGYRFRVTNLTDPLGPNTVQTIERTQNWFSLQMLQRYNYGTLYRIEVAVKTTGTFGGFGAPCEVSSPKVPSLINCGGSVATGTTIVASASLAGVSQYRFQITRASDNASSTIDRNTNYFTFNMVPQATFTSGSLYYVRVAVMTAGTWSPYSDACEIMAPGATSKGNISVVKSATDTLAFTATAYPSPFTNDFSIALKTTDNKNVEVKIYDMLGQLIESKTVELEDLADEKMGTHYPSGVYNVVVNQDGIVRTLRVIKR